jgi:hypothetical protein
MRMKNIHFLAAVLFLSSCVTNRTQPETPIDEPTVVQAPAQEEVIPVIEKPSTLKRVIKDLDLRKASSDKAPRKRVVVLPFLDRDSNRPPEILNRSRMEFMNELNKTQEMVALDSSELKLDLAPFLKNGEYDLNAIAQTTQNLGISSLLEAKVIDVRFKNQIGSAATEEKRAIFEIVVKARLMNVKTGQELFNTVKTVTLEEENTKLPQNISSEAFFAKNPQLVELLLKDAFLDFTGKLADSLSQVMWEGRIAALQGDKIYLNVGQVTGLQIGDILKVVEDGTEVYDPEIGYHIGKVNGKVKGTLEVVGYFGQDGAVGVIHSGAGFKENDRIEIYE